MSDDQDDDGDDGDSEGRQDDGIEYAFEECGQSPLLGGCTLAGTEYCDFDCPYSDLNLFADNDDVDDAGGQHHGDKL